MDSEQAMTWLDGRRGSAWLVLSMCLAAAGCSSGDDPPADGAAGTPAIAGDATAGASGTAAGAGGQAPVAGSPASSGSGTTSGGAMATGGAAAGEPAAGGATGGGGGGGAEAPSCGEDTGDATGGGQPTLQCGAVGGICGECASEKCCDLMELCSVDADCACMATCIGQQSLSGVDGCLSTCALDGSPPGFAPFAECVAAACPDGDECSVPGGFTVPPSAAPSGPTSSAGIGSGDLADCSFDAGLAYDPEGEVLQLQSADGSVCVRVERRNDGPGSLANTAWTLLDVRVGPPGEVVHVDDPGALCWHSSHHNFNDWGHIGSGSRHYDLHSAQADHGQPRTFELHVFEAGPAAGGECAPWADGGCPIGEPIPLLPFP